MDLFEEANKDALDQARLIIWQEFEKVDDMFNEIDDNLSDPVFLKAFLKSVMKRIVAEANIADLLVHKPTGSLGILYPLKECVSVVREELVRSVNKDVEAFDGKA